jgi:hypothetical protein
MQPRADKLELITEATLSKLGGWCLYHNTSRDLRYELTLCVIHGGCGGPPYHKLGIVELESVTRCGRRLMS